MNKIASIFFPILAALAFTGCGGGSSSGTSSAAPADHTAPAGDWGGTLVGSPNLPATLSLTTSGGHFTFYCSQSADMTQQVQPDSSGHFSAAGTSTTAFLPLSPHPAPQPTQFTGTVTNHVMTVTLTVTPASGTSYVSGSYTVTLGQAAPVFQGACPG